MRKIERHALNVRRFGERHCPRQVEVLPLVREDLFLLHDLIAAELTQAGRVGIRTDWMPGNAPRGGALGLLPFRTNMRSQDDVCAFLTEYNVLKRPLSVLVCEAVPLDVTRYNFVTEQVDADNVFVETSRAKVTQRDMYDHPESLRSFFMGPGGHAEYLGKFCRSYDPSFLGGWWPTIYNFTRVDSARTLTGTTTTTGRCLFW